MSKDFESAEEIVPPSETNIASVAVACLIGILGGLVLPNALFVSLNRGILVWLVAVICAGIVLGSAPVFSSKRQRIHYYLLAALAAPTSLCGFLIIRWLFSRLLHPESGVVFIPLGSGASINPLEPSALTILSVLFFIGTLGSFVMVSLSALGARPLIDSASRFWKFGPTGMNRLQRLLVATATTIGVVISVWGAFGSDGFNFLH
jgi:hypothetical protein